jgi:hypothetical protein
MELTKAVAWLLLTAALCVVGVKREPPAPGIEAEPGAVEREPLDEAATSADRPGGDAQS